MNAGAVAFKKWLGRLITDLRFCLITEGKRSSVLLLRIIDEVIINTGRLSHTVPFEIPVRALKDLVAPAIVDADTFKLRITIVIW